MLVRPMFSLIEPGWLVFLPSNICSFPLAISSPGYVLFLSRFRDETNKIEDKIYFIVEMFDNYSPTVRDGSCGCYSLRPKCQ